MINVLPNQVIFLGEFNSKHKQFGCVKPNKSGQTPVNIAKDLKYLNFTSHHIARAKDSVITSLFDRAKNIINNPSDHEEE